MLEESARQILQRVGEEQLVLDVGGGARPFARADWVLDLVPYERRGQLGWDGDRARERFGPQTWVQRDICDHRPWPFRNRQFDFAVCSHTLEDVRDPVWVAHELQRVAAAGYIEVPALREELTYGMQGPWVGWGHHHWLVLVRERGIEFVFKHHVVNRGGSHLPAGAMDGIDPRGRVQTLWWEGEFDAAERFMLTAAELDDFLEGIAGGGTRRKPAMRRALSRLRRLQGRLA